MKNVDIIIIGSGMSGLYSAYKIKQFSPETSFLILEKYKKQWIGGRASNDTFYGTEIVTGAGIGRKPKDKLLYKLLHEFQFETHEYVVNPQKSALIADMDISVAVQTLRREYKNYKDKQITFKQYATRILGKDAYQDFIESAGYTDYENEDVFETLYYYGIEDNACCWKAFTVPWKKLVLKLYEYIGEENFRFSNKATRITKINDNPCKFLVDTAKGTQYMCNKVIVATTIDGIRSLLPNDIYNDIEGQPFLRLYAKFNKKSIPILKEYVKGFTFLPGPLQRIIPMDPNNGVYMIAYNDNKNTLALKNNLENTEDNRNLYQLLLERSLGIPENSLHIIALKDFYWPIGTHYYKPLNKTLYRDREEFIHKAQNPEPGIVVVGEVVSRNQGWTEGALESVKAVITRKWVNE
jgi:2-polyprenyl-6-methoxyphenol hydroxylase-like FAD-dependent oxidoreductase